VIYLVTPHGVKKLNVKTQKKKTSVLYSLMFMSCSPHHGVSHTLQERKIRKEKRVKNPYCPQLCYMTSFNIKYTNL